MKSLPLGEPTHAGPRTGPLVLVAVALMIGILLGRWVPWLHLWWLVAAGFVAVMGVAVIRQRRRAVRCWGGLAVVALGAAWGVVRADYTVRHHIAGYVGSEPQLAEVSGRVEGPVSLRSPQRGPFGRFSYESPFTRFVIRLHSITVSGRPSPVGGKLLVRIDEAEHRIRPGQFIGATGWLGPIRGPQNPGEVDFRGLLGRRGIVGRLSLDNRGNWQPLEAPPSAVCSRLASLRRRVAGAALWSLRLGMDGEHRRLGLLETVLLGRWGNDLDHVHESFRRVGLAHLLAISGAHLGILLGLVWLAVRLLVPHPPRAVAVVLAVLLLYLLVVPIRVPIARASIMAVMFCLGYAMNRRAASLDLLALAAVLVLLWRPEDLFSPGFQLSFAVVAALLSFTRTVAGWIWPPSPVRSPVRGPIEQLARWAINYLAVSLVAFFVAMPLLAYHFQIISPLTVLLSVLSFPLLTAVLGVGYLKILIGPVLPSVSILLSGPLAWCTALLMGLVEHAVDWPASFFELTRPPSLLWTAAMLGATAVLFCGLFARRRLLLVAVAVLLLVWTAVEQHPVVAAWATGRRPAPPAAILNAFAVGDGSCFLLRLPGHTLMYDCGSQHHLDVGARRVVPSLKRLGVRRIDTLILSHAHLDHYSGSFDLIDQVEVGRVLVPPQLLVQARAKPGEATAFLVSGLRQRGLTPRAISRGWRQTIGPAELEIIWPPADFVSKRANDTSLVLLVRTAGRRILLNGDIQQEAIAALLAAKTDLRADVTDLPHHGSIVPASGRWFEVVAPESVVQSCGLARLWNDRWAALFAGSSARRLVTGRLGMVELRIDRAGEIKISSFLGGPSPG